MKDTIRKKLFDIQNDIEDLITQLDEGDAIDVRWNNFVESLEELNDPLVLALMKGAIPKDMGSGVIEIRFKKGHEFFKEWIELSEDLWIDLFQKQFGEGVTPSFEFRGS